MIVPGQDGGCTLVRNRVDRLEFRLSHELLAAWNRHKFIALRLLVPHFSDHLLVLERVLISLLVPVVELLE